MPVAYKDNSLHWSEHTLTQAIFKLLREKAHKKEGVTLEFILQRFSSMASEEEIVGNLMCAAACIPTDGTTAPVSLRLNLLTNKMRFWLTEFVDPESVLLPGRAFGPLYVFNHYKNEDWEATIPATVHQSGWCGITAPQLATLYWRGMYRNNKLAINEKQAVDVINRILEQTNLVRDHNGRWLHISNLPGEKMTQEALLKVSPLARYIYEHCLPEDPTQGLLSPEITKMVRVANVAEDHDYLGRDVGGLLRSLRAAGLAVSEKTGDKKNDPKIWYRSSPAETRPSQKSNRATNQHEFDIVLTFPKFEGKANGLWVHYRGAPAEDWEPVIVAQERLSIFNMAIALTTRADAAEIDAIGVTVTGQEDNMLVFPNHLYIDIEANS